jgi:hypothetical protein
MRLHHQRGLSALQIAIDGLFGLLVQRIYEIAKRGRSESLRERLGGQRGLGNRIDGEFSQG